MMRIMRETFLIDDKEIIFFLNEEDFLKKDFSSSVFKYSNFPGSTQSYPLKQSQCELWECLCLKEPLILNHPKIPGTTGQGI